MHDTQQWIWLPKNSYPHHQTTITNAFCDPANGNYTVAEFRKRYTFDKKVVSAELTFSGDTLFQLYCSDRLLATGPAAVGGDYFPDGAVSHYYAYRMTFSPDSSVIDLFACVQMMPVQLCDFSKGHGGFMLYGFLTFEDGSQAYISTDESWQVRKNNAFLSPTHYDAGIASDAYVNAEIVENLWNAEIAPIPVRQEHTMVPEGGHFRLEAFDSLETTLELERIFAGFPYIQVKASGSVIVELEYRELQEHTQPYVLSFNGSGEYRGFQLCSTGSIFVKQKNLSDTPADITVSYIVTHYPVTEWAETETSDPALNLVLALCKHNLKQCRQTLHLDSPKHCEPLACTGDYYIESLMTLFSFGDLRLAEFDLIRTARTLQQQDGRLFHTTYSLIWVRMLYDVYMATGNQELLRQCKDALIMLLNRFEAYLGDNGLIENPPSFMFVDWICVDGFTLHRPPKALGQTCLNLFYFGALDAAVKIFSALDDLTFANHCSTKKEALRTAVNTLLFDPEKGIYFEGLNTPTPPQLINHWMPENTQKRYYRKHTNILAAYVGICSDDLAKQIIHKVMSDEIEGGYQPYFAHFLLEAVYRCGLREQYTLAIMEQWKTSALQCPKGLVEGFIPPEPNYSFDHSHAWAGTPLYSLPKALMGLEILEPGMGELRLCPSLLGLPQAKAELMTPYGKVVLQMQDGDTTQITHPKEVKITVISHKAP